MDYLKQLYDGKISPSERVFPRNPEYRSLCREIDRERTGLMDGFSQEERARFEQILTLQYEVAGMEHLTQFAYGFRLGAGLMVQVFSGE